VGGNIKIEHTKVNVVDEIELDSLGMLLAAFCLSVYRLVATQLLLNIA
jgi:hypothetical protein